MAKLGRAFLQFWHNHFFGEKEVSLKKVFTLRHLIAKPGERGAPARHFPKVPYSESDPGKAVKV